MTLFYRSWIAKPVNLSELVNTFTIIPIPISVGFLGGKFTKLFKVDIKYLFTHINGCKN